MNHYAINPYFKKEPDWSSSEFDFLVEDAREFHRSLSGYSPTPLTPLPDLAKELGIGELHVKDESKRFEVKAFKPLGASFAIFNVLKSLWEKSNSSPFTPKSFKDAKILAKLGQFTFCAATDGNHGRAVAWTARKLGQKAVIYMPSSSAGSRIESIRSEGAEVRLIQGTFDNCVNQCASDAKTKNWTVIADTAYPGNMELPKHIITGYQTIFHEIEDCNEAPEAAKFDIVILPAGVGGLAAAGASYYVKRYGSKRPKLVCVEPDDSACFLESILHGLGAPVKCKGKLETMMVGLACGTPSLVAWPIIRDSMNLFISIKDDLVPESIRTYKKHGIVSGESGAAGLAGLLELLRTEPLREAKKNIKLGKTSKVLLINTEGDTDPVKYREIIAKTD